MDSVQTAPLQEALHGFHISDGAFHKKIGAHAAQVDDAWKRFAKLAGGEVFAADVQCLAALDAIDVPCAKVQNIADVLADPQIIARHMVVAQDHPVLGKIRLANLPFKFSSCDTSPTCVAPEMGQHNREIPASLGFGAEDIDAMVRDGVLYSAA